LHSTGVPTIASINGEHQEDSAIRIFLVRLPDPIMKRNIDVVECGTAVGEKRTAENESSHKLNSMRISLGYLFRPSCFYQQILSSTLSLCALWLPSKKQESVLAN
jgi:hypothetical protein